MATVAELRTQLDEAEVDYPADAKKAELEELVAGLDTDEAPAEEETPKPRRGERVLARPLIHGTRVLGPGDPCPDDLSDEAVATLDRQGYFA